MIKNLEQLKAKTSISEVIASYLPLKKENGLLKALCPFHNEKTPSFVVHESKGFYHCFGCNESGDAIKFIQKYKHFDFNEAVNELANFYNFELEFENGSKSKSKKDYFAFYERLNEAFRLNLEQNAQLCAYLFKRGLEKEDFKRFDIGLVPDNETLKALIGKDLPLALELGILHKGQDGALFSSFAHRISFAFRNQSFKIVGFSCRVHDYKNFANQGKYINSRQSFLFDKSKFLYNSFNINAKADIIIIVEGFFDCIALQKMGLTGVVASCGTALNKTHLASLLKLASNAKLVLAFDNDEAGLKASLKACELLFLHSFFESEIWRLKGEFKDFGELLQAKGAQNQTQNQEQETQKDEFLSFCTRENAFDFYVKTRLEMCESARQKDAFIKALKTSILKMKHFYLKEFCLTRLSALTGMSISELSRKAVALEPQKLSQNSKKSLFKSILSDEKALFLAKEYLSADFFDELAKSYENFVFKGFKDENALALECDESVSVLDSVHFSKALLFFFKNFYQKELEKAKQERNARLIVELKNKLLALSG